MKLYVIINIIDEMDVVVVVVGGRIGRWG